MPNKVLNNSEKDFLKESSIIGARFFERYLLEKDFLIITDDLMTHEITFKKRDFIHFTGLKVNISDNKFYNLCVKGHLARENISNYQKYNYKTLKDKALVIRKLNKFLHADVSTNLFITNLTTKTRTFPIAITNDFENMTLGFIGNDHHARSIRKAKQSQNYKIAQKINTILVKEKKCTDYSNIIYLRDIEKLNHVIKMNPHLFSIENTVFIKTRSIN